MSKAKVLRDARTIKFRELKAKHTELSDEDILEKVMDPT